MPRFSLSLARAALVLPLLLPLFAVAGEVEEVQKLMQKGAYKDALTLTDKAIAGKPQDQNLRFLKGVLLAQMDRRQEAAAVFTALTQDYPQLAEPYNNLGVLLAASGDLERAREALTRASQIAPGYGTAHENLGDLYARLSAQSYEKAAQLEGASSKTRSKLTLARELSNAVQSGTAGARPVAAAASTAAASAPAAVVAEAPLPPTRSPARQAIVVSGAAPAASAKPAASTPAATSAEEKAVLDAVQKWARAWSARDFKQYIASYANDFHPADGASLDKWKAEREKRIVGRENIQVQVQQPAVMLEGGQARVKFIQVYESGKIKSRDVKELVFKREGQNWLIEQEKVGD